MENENHNPQGQNQAPKNNKGLLKALAIIAVIAAVVLVWYFLPQGGGQGFIGRNSVDTREQSREATTRDSESRESERQPTRESESVERVAREESTSTPEFQPPELVFPNVTVNEIFYSVGTDLLEAGDRLYFYRDADTVVYYNVINVEDRYNFAFIGASVITPVTSTGQQSDEAVEGEEIIVDEGVLGFEVRYQDFDLATPYAVVVTPVGESESETIELFDGQAPNLVSGIDCETVGVDLVCNADLFEDNNNVNVGRNLWQLFDNSVANGPVFRQCNSTDLDNCTFEGVPAGDYSLRINTVAQYQGQYPFEYNHNFASTVEVQ